MLKIKAIVGLLAALALMGLLASCGGDDPTPTSAPTATPTAGPPTATPTALPPGVTPDPTPTADTFSAEWDALIAAAQAEGQVFLALGGGESRTGRPMFAEFERQFGVEIVAGGGAGSTSVNRILAERSRGVFTVDIATVSGGSLERLRAAGSLQPLFPDIIVHPEVVDRSQNWTLDRIVWADRDKLYSMTDSISVGPIGDIWYNTESVTQEELDSINEYQDLLRPEFCCGRIAMRAMNNPGGKSVIARLWLTPGLGPDFLDAIHRVAKVDLVVPEGDDDLANGVASGKWDFGIFGGGRSFDGLQALQLPVRELTLTKSIGGLASEISGGISMLANQPHPAAAKLFMNWWYMQAGQTAKIEGQSQFGPRTSMSQRTDVTRGSLLPHLGVVIDQIPEWQAAGTIDEHLVVFEENEEWFQIRDETEKFFNDLYIELGYDAFVNY